MALVPGTRLGSYEITAHIGAGGMGEVYRASDTSLGRQVAIKVLPSAFARDAERLARFEREARTLASLNHPNIAAIHGYQHADGVTALVMELVDGPTLEERIARGAIEIEEALPIARQIIDALDAAHDLGIVHRDLKPSNIKLRTDGTVKLLDFGLAKALTEQRSSELSASPTMTSPAMTRLGVILGTAAYMSPEQARGAAVDRRSDIWAFGCVLYEMLAGRPAFAADGVSETIAAVLRDEPHWAALPPNVPKPIARLLRRCLERDPGRRLRDIADARFELNEDLEGAELSRSSSTRRAERYAWLSGVALLVLAIMVMAGRGLRPRPDALEVRFDIITPPAQELEDLASLALSPDGATLAFVAPFNGRPHLWLRSRDAVEARSLSRTEEATFPFWSANGRSLGFFAEGQLKRVDLDGGPVATVSQAPAGTGGSWNRDDVIVFAPSPATPIFRIDRDGALVQVTKLERGHAGHVFPTFLPDGGHFIFYVLGAPDVRGVYLGQTDGTPPRRLFDSESAAVYGGGHLLFVREGAVVVQPFDVKSFEPTGPARPLAHGVAGSSQGTARLPPVTAAAVGAAIAFRAGPADADAKKLVWTDRSGQVIGTMADPDTAWPLSPVLSPDGRHIALLRRVDGNADVWIRDVRNGVASRVTDHPAEDIFPVWSRDGRRVVFTSIRDGGIGLYQKPPTLAGTETLLWNAGTGIVFAEDFLPDGMLICTRRTLQTGGDIWALPAEPNPTPYPVLQTAADERDPKLSANGQLIAYTSNSTGRFEVYVDTFPVSDNPARISPAGGATPLWSHDGREVFYVALDGVLTAVPIETAPDGRVDPGVAKPLFNARLGRVIRGNPGPQYAVSKDGRVLLNATVEQNASTVIRMILNWNPQNGTR